MPIAHQDQPPPTANRLAANHPAANRNRNRRPPSHTRSPMVPYLVYPSSCRYCVICVVLPLPVSPTTTTTWFSRITCRQREEGEEGGDYIHD